MQLTKRQSVGTVDDVVIRTVSSQGVTFQSRRFSRNRKGRADEEDECDQ